jgi:hypothetical protein
VGYRLRRVHLLLAGGHTHFRPLTFLVERFGAAEVVFLLRVIAAAATITTLWAMVIVMLAVPAYIDAAIAGTTAVGWVLWLKPSEGL